MFDFKDPEQERLFKEALAEAIDAWLDKQFSKFGKWSFFGILSAVVGGLSYLYLSTKGLK